MSEERVGLMGRMLGWLRAGYPDGVPQSDYVALLGILGRRLTDAEVDSVAHELADHGHADHQITADDIRTMIHDRVFETANEQDVERVMKLLESGGWVHEDDDTLVEPTP